MDPNDPARINASLMGFHAAMGAAIRALLKTHPHPLAIAAAMNHEYQETLALLTANPIPDEVLEAYRMAWVLVGPDQGE